MYELNPVGSEEIINSMNRHNGDVLLVANEFKGRELLPDKLTGAHKDFADWIESIEKFGFSAKMAWESMHWFDNLSRKEPEHYLYRWRKDASKHSKRLAVHLFVKFFYSN